MPALALIMQGLLAALTAAPQAIEIIKQGKKLIGAMRKEGVITKEQQKEADDFADEAQRAALAGEEIPSWTVEPDPED